MIKHHRKSHRAGTQSAYLGSIMCMGALIAFPAKSQDAAGEAPLAPGMRVRIAAPGALPHRLLGEITAIDDETITVEAADSHAPVSIPRNKVVTIDLSEGARSRWVDAGIGAAAGAATAAIACVAGNTRQAGGYVSVDDSTAAAVCGVLGAGIGALLGAVIPPGEHWHRMATSNYRLSMMPRLDGNLGFSVMLKF